MSNNKGEKTRKEHEIERKYIKRNFQGSKAAAAKEYLMNRAENVY
jgi:hypothetical protein